MIINKYKLECHDPVDVDPYELEQACDMRDNILYKGVLIQCEFCDTLVWLNHKEWAIVTCEKPECIDKGIKRYCC